MAWRDLAVVADRAAALEVALGPFAWCRVAEGVQPDFLDQLANIANIQAGAAPTKNPGSAGPATQGVINARARPAA